MIGPNKRDKLHNIWGRLFQARMWRRYAMMWDQENLHRFTDRAWVENVLQVSREECVRRARVNLYLARRLNRAEKEETGVRDI